MTYLALAVVTLTSAFLLVYGANVVYLSVAAARLGRVGEEERFPPGAWAGPLPKVAVQLPIYNERYVAVRALDAAARLDWPRECLLIQVLDDSDDDTAELLARAVARWRGCGIQVEHVRRRDRQGFKAGALAHGVSLTDAELIAIFDADFVPPPDFLRRLVPALRDPRVGFAQARWGHLNERHSLFTRLQALVTDFHFLVEQPVRVHLGLFTNFTGSAGVWRRAAVEDAGGWSAATLTEDLDLSYRAQLRGWRAAYVEVTVPQELPVSVNAYRSQQARWATGSFQCAGRLLWPLLRSRLPLCLRFQAAMHLLGYAAPIAMLAQVASYWLLLAGDGFHHHGGSDWWVAASLLSLAPTLGICVGQARLGRPWWRQLPACLAWSVVGAGTSLTVAAALGRALRRGGEFLRTPKFAAAAGEDWRGKRYFQPRAAFAHFELGAGLAALALALAALNLQRWLMAGYALLFAAGFLALGLGSLAQGVRDTMGFWRAAALLALAGVLLYALSRQPDPFEDSYQHWLVAANLATTGRLRDPLFGMQDTWLPAYSVLAALVLKLVGTWQLGALKLLNAALGLVTLGLTYRLADSPRQGLLAVALLVLNPVFLLTSTTAVTEPLLVSALTGATVAAVTGRPRWAAALACLACLSSTKAWLWLACVAASLLVGAALEAGKVALAWLRRLAWLGPALGLTAVLEVGFGFASHSVARAAQEVGSAAARGSLPVAGPARGGLFLGYLALASLPLAALAPPGLLALLRRRSRDPLLWALHLPALAYLAAVTALVWSGIYSGSHRYYEPALPALALLAASALDRLWAPAGVAATALAAAVTIAYLPVLSGLVDDNRGLVAAGRAAGAVPGALLTDSPVAAYWSRKPPAAIHGSRELPADRQEAVTWLRAHGVGSVVVEDIDYYRAARVLPDLVRGDAGPPFLPVGDEASYSVPGGKRTHVWGLDRTLVRLRGTGLALGLGAGAPARGKTAPLGRGAYLVTGDGKDLLGGGLGFGVPIARFPDGWWYPAPTAALAEPDGRGWMQNFDLSLHEVDTPDGRFLRFTPGPSRASFEVSYRVSGSWLHVSVRLRSAVPGLQEVVVLNEQSALFDDYADANRSRLGKGVASWSKVSGGWARFRAGRLGVEWELDAPPASADYFAARELRPQQGIDFSGLEYVFGGGFGGTEYDVKVRRSP